MNTPIIFDYIQSWNFYIWLTKWWLGKIIYKKRLNNNFIKNVYQKKNNNNNKIKYNIK